MAFADFLRGVNWSAEELADALDDMILDISRNAVGGLNFSGTSETTINTISGVSFSSEACFILARTEFSGTAGDDIWFKPFIDSTELELRRQQLNTTRTDGRGTNFSYFEYTSALVPDGVHNFYWKMKNGSSSTNVVYIEQSYLYVIKFPLP